MSLLALVGIILVFLFVKRTMKEGFIAEYSIPNTARKALPEEHVNYVATGIRKYNPVMNLINPQKNVLLPPDFKDSDVRLAENKLKDAVASILAVPNNPSFKLSRGSTSNISLNYASTGTGDLINKCEAIKTIQCSAFDNPEFAANCGMCHENGKNSSGSNIIGGLFVDEDTKWAIKATAKQQGNPSIKYNPTVGACKNGRFTTTKEECEQMKLKMDCEKTQSFAIPGCSMDYTTESFFYLKPETIKNALSASLVLTGSGTFKISFTNVTIRVVELSSEPETILLPDLKEGVLVSIIGTGASIKLSGYLEGITVNGSFIIDIARLASKKYNMANTSRIIGSTVINKDSYAKYTTTSTSPAVLSINILNPFTFIDLLSSDAAEYGGGPYITKEDSAKFLSSGVCYKKNSDGSIQGPGKYSLECLQDAFVTAGCTTQGEAFPTTDTQKSTLMKIGNMIYDISEQIYTKSSISYSGTGSDGKELTIEEWDAVSRWCTGIRITSPCSIEQPGKYSEKCLKYLWLNLGAKDTRPGGEGPTYSSTNVKASLYNNLDNFCTLNGKGSPTKNGVANTDVINTWNKMGDKSNIKQAMDYIHKKANDNSSTDVERNPYLMSCYGIPLATTMNAINTDTPDQSSNYGGSLLDVPTILPYDTNMVGMIPDPYTKVLSAGIDSKNKEVVYVYKYTSSVDLNATIYIIAATHGILFVNGQQLTSKFFVWPDVGFRGQPVKLVKGVNTIKVNVINPTGPANLAFIARAGISNPVGESLFSSGSSGWKIQGDDYLSVLDNNPGRTKTPFIGKPNYKWDSDYTKETIFVLGPLGTLPWLNDGNWTRQLGAIPAWNTNTNMKWIWYTNNANYGAPVTERGLYKIYTHTGNNPIDVGFTFVVDDIVTYAGINNNAISSASIIVAGTNLATLLFKILPGENFLQINCKNLGGPAGFIGVCFDKNGAILFQTDSSWGWMQNKTGTKP